MSSGAMQRFNSTRKVERKQASPIPARCWLTWMNRPVDGRATRRESVLVPGIFFESPLAHDGLGGALPRQTLGSPKRRRRSGRSRWS